MESSKEVEKELELLLQQSEAKLADNHIRLTNLDERLSSTLITLESANKEIAKLNIEVQLYSRKFSDEERKRREYENENESLHDKVRILEATAEDLRSRLDEAEEEVVFKQSDLETLRSAMDEETRRYQERIMELEEDVRRFQGERKEKTEEETQFRQQSLESAAEIHHLESMLNDLQMKNNELSNQLHLALEQQQASMTPPSPTMTLRSEGRRTAVPSLFVSWK